MGQRKESLSTTAAYIDGAASSGAACKYGQGACALHRHSHCLRMICSRAVPCRVVSRRRPSNPCSPGTSLPRMASLARYGSCLPPGPPIHSARDNCATRATALVVHTCICSDSETVGRTSRTVTYCIVPIISCASMFDEFVVLNEAGFDASCNTATHST
jgi:hypothetical protein